MEKAKVNVGDFIRCNDPRYGWTAEVEQVVTLFGVQYALIHPRPGSRVVRVRFDRIFTDGKLRKQGYNLLEKNWGLPTSGPTSHLGTFRVTTTGLVYNPLLSAQESIKHALPAKQGEGGEAYTYKVIARTINFGVRDKAQILEVLAPWNETCQPPWSEQELSALIDKVFLYSRPGAVNYGAFE